MRKKRALNQAGRALSFYDVVKGWFLDIYSRFLKTSNADLIVGRAAIPL